MLQPDHLLRQACCWYLVGWIGGLAFYSHIGLGLHNDEFTLAWLNYSAHILCWNGDCCLFNCQFGFWQFDFDYWVTAYIYFNERHCIQNDRHYGSDTMTSLLFLEIWIGVYLLIEVMYGQWLILMVYKLEMGTIQKLL